MNDISDSINNMVGSGNKQSEIVKEIPLPILSNFSASDSEEIEVEEFVEPEENPVEAIMRIRVKAAYTDNEEEFSTVSQRRNLAKRSK